MKGIIMREQIIAKGFDKAKKIYMKMLNSDDVYDTKKMVKITKKKLVLEINCIRTVKDDDGNSIPSLSGGAFEYQIYAIIDGKDVDGITGSTFENTFDGDLMYLLKCYV